MPKRANAISHESSNYVESPKLRRRNKAQPPSWPELNLCIPCETGMDRQREGLPYTACLASVRCEGLGNDDNDRHENSATHLGLCSAVQGVRMENLCRQWQFVCWRNDLLIPLRSAPHACSGRRAKRGAQARCLQALGNPSPRNSHFSYGPHIHESRLSLRGPSGNRFCSPETGVSSKKCSTDWR